MPRKSGTVQPKRAGKKSVMSREQVLKMEKIEKIRSSAPLQIMDGLKARRGRPKRQWPNPMTRLNPYEDVPMVVKPQTTAEPQIERKSKGPLPPLKIVMESAPGTKRSKRNVTVTKFDEPEEVETDALGEASLLAHAEAGLPHHVQVPPGYSYEEFRRASKSPSEAPSDTSTPNGSYPSTPLSTHYHATPGLMSPPTFYHSPSELNSSMGVNVSSISLPPLLTSSSSAPHPWLTLPTLHYGRVEAPPWPWAPAASHSFYQNSYHSADGYHY
ncbi:hypothetical protein AOL_s00079g82 [Orbilia oligospora ATCC 24927]|uniref:Uncharacterized protein n=1 Tax=Arthrobotrys oligospora (strain ATCC 24927 / CBS 115.81 / DSM 1491) TaxID=756982 RepID=G1XCP7_ARTOA|nr:hypothetical protein AOL_s00079g82 [Orbilia oligospora ATCC 24927]EGX49128.1 hypothetical protein AOL_s00079g82 [Orbilia oligospora ATCC 24927]